MRFTKIFLAVILALSLFACFVSCIDRTDDLENTTESTSNDETTEAGHTVCTDTDPRDNMCDVCGKGVPCQPCIDEKPQNGECDVCGRIVVCETCVDANPKNSKCDVCGRILLPCQACADESPKDAKCDVCGKDVPCVTCVDEKDGIHDATCDVCGKNVIHDTIDASLEEAAQAFLQEQSNFKIIETSDYFFTIDMVDLRLPMHINEVTTRNVKDGNKYQRSKASTYMYNTDMLYMLISSEEVTATQIGTTLYVQSVLTEEDEYSGNYESSYMNFLINSTPLELQAFEDEIVKGVDSELGLSVNHFMAINVSTDKYNNTVYTCYKLRPEISESLNDFSENMFDYSSPTDTDMAIDYNSFEYILAISPDGHAVYCYYSFDATMNMELYGENVAVDVKMSSEHQYLYDPSDVTVPQVDNTWINMTLTEYFAMSREDLCENDCIDNNNNAFCDNCGTALRCPLGCTDGSDSYSGYCDVCYTPVSQ